MNPENRIEFNEASQSFLCEEYYANNFAGFLQASSLVIDSPQKVESAVDTTDKNFSVIKLTEKSRRLTQGEGNALITEFLEADDESKAKGGR
ncbi:MAG TPA: hypothetical protein VIS99_07215 [Terrimicrobiaceae bacterium]